MLTYRDHLTALLDIIETDESGDFFLPNNDHVTYIIGSAILFVETEKEPWTPKPPPQNRVPH